MNKQITARQSITRANNEEVQRERSIRTSVRSGTEEDKPDHTEDQYREAGGDKEESKHRRPRLGLPRFGWRFNDAALLLCCHDALGSLMLRQGLLGALGAACREQRTISDDVPDFVGCYVRCQSEEPCRYPPAHRPTGVNAVRRFLTRVI